MDFFFVGDAQQKRPSRPGMGSLLALGGIYVPEQAVKELERRTEELCAKYGFPPYEVFKWSPGRKLWMHDNLLGEKRQEFFVRVLDLANENETTATVVIEDTTSKTAIEG